MLELEAETVGYMKEWLHENKDLMLLELIMQDLTRGKYEPPKNQCGECAAYKTPFCTFGSHSDVIRKKDQACTCFFPDRHISRSKLKKPRVVYKAVRR